MQRLILSKKNQITVASAILISIAFLSKWTIGTTNIFVWSLVIASVLGVAPVAIQAYQALRVKVISIDVLVTLAVAGHL